MKFKYFTKKLEKHTVVLALVKKSLKYPRNIFWSQTVGTHSPGKISCYIDGWGWDTLYYGDVPKNMAIVGFAVIGEKYKRKSAQALVVRKDFRRCGVATGMYNYYESKAGVSLKPSDNLSSDGKEFWYARKQATKRKNEIHST